MYVIYAKREDDYFAFSKDGKETIFLNGLKALVHQMQGTDILIYKI